MTECVNCTTKCNASQPFCSVECAIEEFDNIGQNNFAICEDHKKWFNAEYAGSCAKCEDDESLEEREEEEEEVDAT